MKRATVTETKNGLSALLAQVKGGETVVILDRGVPVARLEPIVAGAEPEGRIQRLERAGIVAGGSAAPPVDRIRKPGPSLDHGASAVEAVLQERRKGR
jgi:antitoxin (DNA-binding transcriptional repressor) of toxin-antitoxin stability system